MTDETSEAGKATAALSHERLAAIHGRLAPISAWPWRLDERHVEDTNHVYSAPDGVRQWLVAGTPRIPIRPRSKGQSLLDAEFIAHAPEDIDALLTEMEQLREQNEQLRAELDDALRDLADCEAEPVSENRAIALRSIKLTPEAASEMARILADPAIPGSLGEELPTVSAEELLQRFRRWLLGTIAADRGRDVDHAG